MTRAESDEKGCAKAVHPFSVLLSLQAESAEEEQQLAKIIGHHDALVGMGNPFDEQMYAQDEVGGDEKQCAEDEADTAMARGRKAHRKQEDGIDCDAVADESVFDSREYPHHRHTINGGKQHGNGNNDRSAPRR